MDYQELSERRYRRNERIRIFLTVVIALSAFGAILGGIYKAFFK